MGMELGQRASEEATGSRPSGQGDPKPWVLSMAA